MHTHTDYNAFIGASPGSYAASIPAHLFPQWCFPAITEAFLATLPFPLSAVLNQGCKIEIHGTVPRNEALTVTAQVTFYERAANKIKMATTIRTGSKSNPNALVCEMYSVIPGLKPKGAKKVDKTEKKVKVKGPKPAGPMVPAAATDIAKHTLTDWSGVHYANLSGDYNPIHSSAIAARASGFPNVIFHGFGQLALCFEVCEHTTIITTTTITTTSSCATTAITTTAAPLGCCEESVWW
jgi:hypothetical protein